MASAPRFDADDKAPRRHMQTALVVLVVLALLFFAFRQLTAPITRKVKKDEAVLAVQPNLPPPPPPPPPPPQPQQKAPEPSEQPKAAAPQAAPNAPPQQMQMDASASSGASGIAAGGGSGMGAPGSCLVGPCGNGGGGSGAQPINQGFYARALASDLQGIIDRNRKLGRLVFDAKIYVTVSSAGVVTAVQMVSPSGKSDVDQELLAALKGVHVTEPQAGIQFPCAVKIRGRKAFS